jgi:hypothetical protein
MNSLFPCFSIALAGLAAIATGSALAEDPKLPVSQIVLYSSGVGYFQRDGQVEGRTAIDLRFKVDDINDLLKSMVVQDLDGGQVSTVTYGSRDPLTKTLKSFGLDLTADPSLGQLLNQARGERVEVLHPNSLVGTIVGVEHKVEDLGDKKTVERDYLNLLTAEGLQSVPLTQAQQIKLLNKSLDAELRQALEALSTGHDTQKKTVTVNFEGQGKRKVSVAYIAQTPVWKTSYRLVLDEKEAPYLQGWAIVENTSDEDWDNVRLSLISGRPISFIMDLYQPLYTSRPVVQPELYTSLRPQVYGEALEEQKLSELAARQEPESAKTAFGAAAAKSAATPERLSRARVAGRTAGNAGIALAEAPGSSADQAFLFQSAALTSAQGTQTGELFQYVIKTPVSLARQKSAMLPIVSQNVEGRKVSIYNESVQAKYPLNGFRLKNSTPLHFMQGPITVFDGGAYAGDARLEDLASGQERLISYALDIKTEVEPQSGAGQQELTAVKVKKGLLEATRKASEQKTYTIRNRDQKKKTVLVEHPFRSDWELIEPKEPAERTRQVYRFAVNVEPDKTSKLVVREQKQLTETVQLVDSASDVIAFYLRSRVVSPAVKDALAKVVTLRDRLNKTMAERTRREQRVQEITQEQARIRENMAKLSQSDDLYSRYVKKLDQQETELENLRQEIESLKATEVKQQRELGDYLLSLEVQ